MKNGKSFRCEVLGWHTPTTICVRRLPTTFESTCKRCGRPIMQDSQGNWFSYAEKGGTELYREETCKSKDSCDDYKYWHCVGCNGCKKGGTK